MCLHTKFEKTSLATPSEGMLIESQYCYLTVKGEELYISFYHYTKFLGTALNITRSIATSEVRAAVTLILLKEVLKLNRLQQKYVRP
jgi:hypothetical protein